MSKRWSDPLMLCLCTVFLLPLRASAQLVLLDVRIDTTLLTTVPGFWAFDFIDGDGLINKEITLSRVVTDATLGALTRTGDVQGDLLPGPARLGDGDFFNRLLQEVVFGTPLSFRLALLDTAPPGLMADTFTFFLLDAAQQPFPSGEPSGSGALFRIDSDALGITGILFRSNHGAVDITLPPEQTVSEPPVAALLAAGMLGLFGRRWRRKPQLETLAQP